MITDAGSHPVEAARELPHRPVFVVTGASSGIGRACANSLASRDSFASGLIYGLQTGLPIETALEYGVAPGALAMTTPGDTSMATLPEVRALVEGASARVQR